MALSDLAVFSEYAYAALTEVLSQQVNAFNAASNGTIILRSAAHQGDYSDIAFWANIAGLVRRRNAYGSGAVSEKTLAHLVDTMVKVAAGTPPVRLDPGQFNWIQRNQEEGGAVYGQQLAKAAMADMLNTALMAYVAAVKNAGAAVFQDVSAGTTTFASLLTGAKLFGDRASDLRIWAMHSDTLFAMYKGAVTNATQLFNFGTVQIMQDGFGRSFVVSDSPSLLAGGGDYYVGGMVPGAIRVDQNADFDQNIDTTNGDENITRTIQSEWSYNLGIKGYSWDKTNGGKSPNDAALATGTNWDKYATSIKDTAGVLLQVAAMA